MEHFWVATAMVAVWIALWTLVMATVVIVGLLKERDAARAKLDGTASARLLREVLGWLEGLGFTDAPGQCNGLQGRIRRHLGLAQKPFVPYASAAEFDYPVERRP